jgi:branched-chain amino acid transport system substrate-binding protein
VNPASRTVAESFEEYFENFGGTIQSSLSYVKSKEALVNYEKLFAPLLEDKVPVVLLPNDSSDVIKQVNYLLSQGYQGVFLGSDNWSPRKLIPLEKFDGAYFTHHWQASSKVNNTISSLFIDEYKKEFQLQPTSMSALTYDAFIILTEAIIHSGFSTASIQQSLLNISELPGVTRNITLNNKTGNMNQPIIFQIKNKASHLINYEE